MLLYALPGGIQGNTDKQTESEAQGDVPHLQIQVRRKHQKKSTGYQMYQTDGDQSLVL